MLDEARGVYFTWLAQDDLLLSPDYITTTVEYLERHPDVVCCASALIIYDNEVPGPGPTMAFPEIHPDRPWHQARLELFRWPQRPVHLAIYGMYRRAALQQVPFVRRIYRGRPNADCWEMPVLTGLMRYGRIVALPSPLRGYRDSLTSDGHRIIREASPFDFLVLGFWMKLLLIQRAWQLPGPCHRRLPVLRLLLRSLFRANLRRPMDYRTLAGTYAAELAMLRETARERAQVIEVLQHAIRESHQQRRARDQDPGPPRWNVDASPRDRTIPGQPPPSTDRPHADAAPPHSPPDVHASPHPAPDVCRP